MNYKLRLSIVFFLGAALWVLILHDLYWIRTLFILKHESIGYLAARLTRYWAPLLAAAIVLFVLVGWISGIFFKKGKPFHSSKRVQHLLPAILGFFMVIVALLLLINYRGIPPLEWSAPLSLLIFVSLILFSTFSNRRFLLLSHIVLALIAVGLFITPHFFSEHRAQLKRLDEFINREKENLLREKESLSKAAQIFEANQMLGQVEEEKPYRFHDNLDKITSVNASPYDPAQGILFKIPDRGPLMVVQHSQAVPIEEQNGHLIISEYKGGTLLQSQDHLGLDISSIGSFIIRMKVSDGLYFRIYWNEGSILNPEVGIQIPLASPRKYATYEIKEAIHSISRLRKVKRINRIFIIPSDKDAQVEIEFITILNKSASVCRKAPVELGYENLGGETRSVLYTRSPSEIIYTVTIPANKPVLSFGSATADPRIAVKFQCALREKGKEIVLLSEEVKERNEWKDHNIDLGRWAGHTVQILFRTNSDLSNVAFWSNPILISFYEKKLNVVVYLIDALRTDHLGIYGYQKNTSPYLDQFAQSGVVFEKAYSNGCTTRLSVPSLFTSNPITATGVWHNMSLLSDAYPTLAEILRSQGYTTATFTANVNAGPFSGTHQGFSQLFEKQYFQKKYGEKEASGKKLDAKKLIHEASEWLESHRQRNFFLYIHTVDAHGPFDPPEEYRTFLEKTGKPVKWQRHLDPPWLKEPTRQTRLALYDGEIAYGDFYLGQFLNKLQELDILDNTLVIITADHGEYFGEHRMWGHETPPYVQGTNIPLIVVCPDIIPSGLRINQNVQILDIMPTILDVLDIDIAPFILQGRSLLPLINGEDRLNFEKRAVYIESDHAGIASIHFSHFHYIPEKNFLFDLTSDPEEKHYLNHFIFNFGIKSRLRQLSQLYNETYSELNRIMSPQIDETLQIDPETLEQLRALGYID